ncbi:hypothetical protein [Terracoccus luteus]|uniref:Drug/metabolite transporter (DMT)-like permease n=1 Tax=Terracoccus luteus TaxID=53356 RepID=A0A839PYJ1_9MICO|nr:hypothetical protein [Terracoccus luteus]MBB2987774.1 drug/metabolite transporter (DMT)-like permease [Terracoccus luteus]MCP2173425.1 drug/metabolite transporter (DMT)-like permease [Terracoccus luteus]
MTTAPTLPLLAVVLSALAYGSATVLQAVGVRALARTPRRPLGAWLTAGRWYVVGLVLDLGGFLASVVALRTLPLFVVESAVASSVAVTAVLSSLVLGQRLVACERLMLLVVLVGLVGLAVGAEPGPGLRPPAVTTLLVASVLVVAALVVVALRVPREGRVGLVVLSAAAGLGFGGVGVAARVLVWPTAEGGVAGQVAHLVTDPVLLALVAHGILATVAYALALERGSATTVAAVTFAVETVVPSAVGLVWLGDAVRPGGGWVAVVTLGFAATLGGAVGLAGRAEPADATGPAAPIAPADPAEPTEPEAPAAHRATQRAPRRH